MNKEQLTSHLDTSTEQLLQAIEQFSQEQFNTIPFPGSWTGGQVAQHLYMAESGIPSVLQGNTSNTTRDTGEKIPQIEAVFLDYNTKFQSPQEILPTEEKKDKQQYINNFIKLRRQIRELALSLDLTATCTDVPFPGMDLFTRLEWLWFIKCHAERHTRQLNNIYKALTDNTG